MRRALAFVVMVLAIMIIAVSCEEPHVHTFSEEWTSDATYHWHKATCGHDEEKGDKAEHVWGEYEIDKDSTETEKGSKHRVCSVCGYTETSVIAEKQHDHNLVYRYNGSKHWQVCTKCGEEFDAYSHSFSYVNAGSSGHYQKCHCGYSKSTEIHVYDEGSQKIKKENNENVVYYICDLCGYDGKKADDLNKDTKIATAVEVKEIKTGADGDFDKVTTTTASGKETETIVNTNDVSLTVKSDASETTSETTGGSTDPSTSTQATGTTKVTFPAGALKVDENATEVSLIINAAPVTAASKTEYTDKTDDASTSKPEVVLDNNQSVVAGFEFKLIGADGSDLTGTETGESSETKKKGTTVETYIAKGLGTYNDTTQNLKVVYVGNTVEENDNNKAVINEYNTSNGYLKFTVYHFSKYAIVSTNMVAVNDDNYFFESLADAIGSDTTSDDSTIRLLKNDKLTKDIAVKKNLTIDLNQKTLDMGDYSIELEETSSYSLTLKNGTIKTATNSYDNCAFGVFCGNSLCLDGINLEQTGTGFYMYGLIYAELDGDSADSTGGPTVTIKDSILTSNSMIVNVDGALSNTTRKANVTIENSTLESTGSKASRTVLIGCPSVGKIKDSRITGSGNKILELIGGTHTISKTTIESKKESKNVSYDSALYVGYTTDTISNENDTPTVKYYFATVSLSDVELKTTANADIPDVYIEGEGTTLIGFNEAWTFNADFNGAAVKSADEKTWYVAGAESLENAISGVKNDPTIKLLSDYTGDIVLNGKTLTFDFNGKTITGGIAVGCQNTSYYINDPCTKSTIVFEDSGSNGGIVNTRESNAALVVKGNSCVTINGGSFSYRGTGNSSRVILLDRSTLNINGGSIKNKSTGKYGYCIEIKEYNSDVSTANITIKNGEFSTCSGSWGYLVNVASKSSTLNLTINGGEYKTKGTWGYIAKKPSNGKIIVNDGTFELGGAGQVFDVMESNYSGYDSATPVEEKNNIEINGGKFTIGNGTNINTRGFVYCNNTTDNVYGYVPKSLKLNGGKINCGTIHEKILEESSCKLVQESEDSSYYVVTPITTK